MLCTRLYTHFDVIYNVIQRKKTVLCNICYLTCYVAHFMLHNMLNIKKIYTTHYIYPSITQTCCWDVMYNIFLGSIFCCITCKVLYSIFFCSLGSILPFFLVMQVKIGDITSYVAAFGRLTQQRWYITGTRQHVLNNAIRVLTAYIQCYQEPDELLVPCLLCSAVAIAVATTAAPRRRHCRPPPPPPLQFFLLYSWVFTAANRAMPHPRCFRCKTLFNHLEHPS